MGRFKVKAVADTLGVSRSNLIERLKVRAEPRRRYQKAQDAAVLPRVRRLVDARPTRAAEKLTGVAHSEFVRIRKPDLKRFTCDRLIEILNKLGQQVEVVVSVTPKSEAVEGDRSPLPV